MNPRISHSSRSARPRAGLSDWLRVALLTLAILGLAAPAAAQTVPNLTGSFPTSIIQGTSGSLSTISGTSLRVPIDGTLCGSNPAVRVRIQYLNSSGIPFPATFILPASQVVATAIFGVPYDETITAQLGTISVRAIYETNPSPGVFEPCFTTNSIDLQVRFGILPTELSNGFVGEAYGPVALAANGAAGPVVWQVLEGALPPGLTLSSTGVISGTPTTRGQYYFLVRATDSTNPDRTDTRDFYLPIWDRITILPPTLPNGVVGQAYSQTFNIGTGNELFTEDTLPPGLSIESTYNEQTDTYTFRLAGTPTTAGTYTFTVEAYEFDYMQEGTAGYGTRQYTVQIFSSIQVTTTNLPAATLGVPYQTQLLSNLPSGTPVVWSITAGSLPPGLALASATGVISGTPAQIGSFGFTVRVALAGGNGISAPVNLTLLVVTPPLTLAPLQLSAGEVSAPYSALFTPSGGIGAYVLSIASGALPPGLSLNPTTRTISGVPTQPGLFRFVMRVVSGSEILEQGYTINIDPEPVTITTAALQDGYRGQTYVQNIAATGGIPPYAFRVSVGALPPAVTLNANGGLVGQPGSTGVFNFTVTATDSRGAFAQRAFTLTILAPLELTGPTPLPPATEGESYSATLTATGGKTPYAFALLGGALPAGMTLSSTGAVSGTPTSPGIFVFTAQVTDANGRTAQRAIELNVIGALRLSPESLPEATRMLEYSVRLMVQGGLGPYQWAIEGGLPPGIAFEAGLFRGAATAVGSFPVNVTVTDSRNRSLSRQYTIVVVPGVTILTTSLPAGTAGQDYETTLTAERGTPPYRWLISSALPQGLTLDPATGRISGRPTAAGSFGLAARVEDQNNLFDTASLTLTINAPPPPPLRITELPTVSPPAQQPNFAVVLDAPFPLPLEGEVDLTFEPARGPDDPAVQFANGARRMPFTIPAGQTRANFASPSAVQTGTVAGLVTLTSTYRTAGVDVTPSPAPRQTLRIDPAAPVLTRLDLVRSASGFELVVFGYSTPRDITRANVRLTAAPGATLTSTELTIDLNPIFTTWYNSNASFPFGSQFRLSLPFTLTGSAADISSAAVTLTNSVGTSNSLSSNF